MRMMFKDSPPPSHIMYIQQFLKSPVSAPWFYCLQVAVGLDSFEEKDEVTDLRGKAGMCG